MRILVCGSREFYDENIVEKVLRRAEKYDGEITLVHGDCPRGADHLADKVARKIGWNIEKHPADWNTHGKKAGFIRNSEMVESGVDYCIAFTTYTGEKTITQGTAHTVRLAKKKGIPTRVIYLEIE